MITTFATPAATAAPDYTPALIGLGGVILGGLIQLIAQWRFAVEQQVHVLREECAEVSAAVAHYAAAMAQAVRYSNELHETGEDTDEEYFKRLGDGVFDGFVAVYNKTLAVAARKDRPLATQAMKVHNLCTRIHNEGPLVFVGKRVTNARAEEMRSEANHEASVLLTMVEPRWWEKYWRFRSAKSASQLVADEKMAMKDPGGPASSGSLDSH